MQKVQVGDVYGQLTVIQLNAKESGNHKYHLCQCSCGEQCLKRTDNLRGAKNPSCGCTKITNKKDRVGDKNGLLTIIEAYIRTDGKHSWHKCQCDCGQICEIRTDNFRRKIEISCGCTYTNVIKNKVGDKQGLLTIINAYVKNDGKHSYHQCQCECGNVCMTRADYFRNNEKISCGCNYDNCKKIKKGDKYGLLTVIEPYVRDNGHESWHKCVCECGNIREIRRKNLQIGKMPSCGCINSKGEMIIRKMLDSNYIKYQQQYCFSDLISVNNARLYFDFAILNDKDEIILLIEYNGQQHYDPIEFFGGEERLKTQQKNDNLKIEYCKSHNTPLLIIPYWDFNKIEELVLNQIEEVKLSANCRYSSQSGHS